MRLSEAIELGRVLINDPYPFDYCSCAIGMGVATVHGSQVCNGALAIARNEWPWLEELRIAPVEVKNRAAKNGIYGLHELSARLIISHLYWAVWEGELALERLIRWVRENEPDEVSQTRVAPAVEIDELIPV
jgi:hypothetical protein